MDHNDRNTEIPCFVHFLCYYRTKTRVNIFVLKICKNKVLEVAARRHKKGNFTSLILFPNVLPPSPLENTDIMRLVYWSNKILRIKDLLLQLN